MRWKGQSSELAGGRDPETFREASRSVSVPFGRRIRRTINLSMELVADLDAGRLKNESKAVDELYRAIEDLHGGLIGGWTCAHSLGTDKRESKTALLTKR